MEALSAARGATVAASEAYRTARGVMIQGTAEAALASPLLERYKGKVQPLFTSPTFPLNSKKQYGNQQGEAYVKWLSSFAPLFCEFLKPDGSIVIEMGNAWEPGKPAMSTLALRALLAFLDAGKLYLCQQFVCYNPARLPTPAQWVNVERIRVKDAFTHVWWMSTTDRPKANNGGAHPLLSAPEPGVRPARGNGRPPSARLGGFRRH